MNFINRIMDRFYTTHHALLAGVYHFQSPADASNPMRLHLRIESDGEGVMIVNARTILHLNPTATEYAYHLIQQTPEQQVARELARRYRVSPAEATQDYSDFKNRIQALIDSPDLDPVSFLNMERIEPYSQKISAPYRLDCALTYKTTGASTEEVAPFERVRRELLTDEWKQILTKAWEAGIPHVVFTGGEPTLRPDLTELIAHAEKLGQVTGLLTNGNRLSDPTYLHDLLLSGLDHLMLLLDPGEDQAWEALRDVLAEDIFTTVHLTLISKNSPEIRSILNHLAEMGVKSISLSSSSPELDAELTQARDVVANLGMTLVWDLPVPYSTFHPLALELREAEQKQIQPGLAFLYVEPDGDMLPSQGREIVLGNLLSQPWIEIWQKRLEVAQNAGSEPVASTL